MSGYFVVLTRNCLARVLDYIVMQMKKTNREKGYWERLCKITADHYYQEMMI